MSSAMNAEKYKVATEAGDYDGMESELRRFIDAKPTELHPYDREALLVAIISNLEDKESAPWIQWPPSLYLTTLETTKVLSRNPVGSTPLIEGMRTILHHTSLPLPPSASPFSHPPPNGPDSQSAREALSIVANTCVLHTAGAKALARAGGGLAIATALKEETGLSNERVFLLARLGFLATLGLPEIVRPLVDNEELVESLVLYLTHTPVIPASYNVITDLLKFTYNVIQFYPKSPEEWSDKLVPLLAPILAIFHSIPSDVLISPLSNAIHTLLSIPYTEELQPIWSHVRPPPLQTSPSKTFDKLSSMLSGQPRRSIDSIKESLSLSPPSSERRSPSPTRNDDVLAVPGRLLKVVGLYFDQHLKHPIQPDDSQRTRLDDELPPVLALLLKLVVGSKEIRRFVKDQIMPKTLDRSDEAGPLEKRPTVLGTLIRLMNCVKHASSRDTACELIWALCDSDPSTLTTEIGYGNAAGLLFRKGLSGPPPAKIEEIDEDTSVRSHDRNPITSLAPPIVEPKNPLDEMTDEEKEREAEKLFVLFDRMEKNPVISMNSGDGQRKGPKDIMREKLERGELEGDDAKQKQEEEKRDEEEAMADLRRYKERQAKK